MTRDDLMIVAGDLHLFEILFVTGWENYRGCDNNASIPENNVIGD